MNELKIIVVKYCKTSVRLADPMTKSLSIAQFRKLFRKILVQKNRPKLSVLTIPLNRGDEG